MDKSPRLYFTAILSNAKKTLFSPPEDYSILEQQLLKIPRAFSTEKPIPVNSLSFARWMGRDCLSCVLLQAVTYRSRWRKFAIFSLTLTVSFPTTVQCTSQKGAWGQHPSMCITQETEAMFNLFVLLPQKTKLFPPQKIQANKTHRKAHNGARSRGWEIPLLLCTEVYIQIPSCALPAWSRNNQEDTEGYVSLTWIALEKMYVHNPKPRHNWTLDLELAQLWIAHTLIYSPCDHSALNVKKLGWIWGFILQIWTHYQWLGQLA